MYLVAIFVLIAASVIWILRRERQLPPGPWGLPILGYLPFLNPKVPYKTLQHLSQRYGPIYSIHLGTINTVVLSEESIIREFLRREEFTARAPLYITHGIMGGHGIICAEGLLWKDQRRQVIEWLKRIGMIKFGSSRFVLEQRIRAGIDDFCKMIGDESTRGLDLSPMHALHHTMGNILNDLVFGVTYAKDDVTWKYLQELQEEGVKHIGVSGVVNFLPFLRFLPSNRKIISFLLDGKRKTHQIYDRIIGECRIRLDTNNEEKNDQYDRPNILECFLEEKNKRLINHDPSVKMWTDDQLRHLLADMFGAGVDTTLTTLRWLLLYLAKYEKYQDLLRKDLSVFEKDNMTFNDIEGVDFLKACVSEAQRIRTVVPLGIPHGTMKDVALSGYMFPKGTMIIPLLWAVHMNPDRWSNPEEYDPFRFITEEGKYFIPANFIPFQTGKRMCPGEDLAKKLLYLYLASIIVNFQISLPADPLDIDMQGECGITLTPPTHTIIFKPILF